MSIQIAAFCHEQGIDCTKLVTKIYDKFFNMNPGSLVATRSFDTARAIVNLN